jgi:hypothetical protein
MLCIIIYNEWSIITLQEHMHDSTVRDNNIVYNPEEGINNV